MFYGWFSLDCVDDPAMTESNIDHMFKAGLGDGLIPIWNIKSSYRKLNELIQKHDPAIVGVGGSSVDGGRGFGMLREPNDAISGLQHAFIRANVGKKGGQ